MDHLPLFALTGGIASGKSTVASMLASHGAVIIDSDLLARDAVDPATETGRTSLQQIASELGQGLINPDGTLNRADLGQLVFTDPKARETLNSILHPAIRSLAAQQSAAARAAGERIIIHDIPLLYETGRAEEFDAVITVETPEEARIERMVSNRGMSEADARARISAQATDEQRRSIADIVIENTGTLDQLSARIEQVFEKLKALAERD